MTIQIHSMNCGSLSAPGFGYVPCRCLLLAEDRELAIVDTGIGLLDVRDPTERIGQQLIELAGFQFDEQDTAVRRIEELGYRASDVRHIILTHGDPDHTGGLADFPEATVHISREELSRIQDGWWRYRPPHFEHSPTWKAHGSSTERWYGLEARPIPFGSMGDVHLIPLFGHTRGHCGVAIRQDNRWLLHAGDSIYLQIELERDDHPVSTLAAQRADDNALRMQSLEELRRIVRDHADVIDVCCYHDASQSSIES